MQSSGVFLFTIGLNQRGYHRLGEITKICNIVKDFKDVGVEILLTSIVSGPVGS